MAQADSRPHFSEILRRERIPHLSFSQVTTVETCEYRYYLQYILGVEPEPVPEYFTKGKLLHEVIAGAYGHLQQGLPLEPAAYHTYLESNYHGVSLHHLVNSMEVMLQNLWLDVTIQAIEHPFVMVLDEDLPPFVGVIDLVLDDGETLYLIDHKTGRSFYQPDTMQMVLYREYASSAFNRTHIQAFYDQYRWVENLARIRKPAFNRVEVPLAGYDVQQARQRVRSAQVRIESIQKRGKPSAMGSCFACPFQRMCTTA